MSLRSPVVGVPAVLLLLVAVPARPDDAPPVPRYTLDVPDAPVHAVAVRPDGKSVLVAAMAASGKLFVAPFDAATVALARTAAALTREGSLVSVAGGGDTVAALNHAGVANEFTYISTAGGAFLEWMEGRELPGVAALTI